MDTLKKIFASVLHIPESVVTDSLSAENTESWDSLSVIILLSEIEKAFDISFTIDEAMSITSFSDAHKLIAAKGVIV